MTSTEDGGRLPRRSWTGIVHAFGERQGCSALPADSVSAKRTQLDHWLDQGPGTCLRKTFARINRALGDPGRIRRAVRAAVLGIRRSGTAVAARHKIGIATQFLQICAEVMRSGIWFEEYYLYQLYLPERWRSRARQFPKFSQSRPA